MRQFAGSCPDLRQVVVPDASPRYNEPMPKRSSNRGKKHGLNTLAKAVVDQATADEPTQAEIIAKAEAEGKNPAAVMLGRLGGLKGGKARAKKLSAARRKEIAQKAARARWGRKVR